MAVGRKTYHPSIEAAMAFRSEDEQTPEQQPSRGTRVPPGHGCSNGTQPSTGSSQQQRACSSSPSPRGSRKGKNGPKKQPQRGPGVAQLEKMRIEEHRRHQQAYVESLHAYPNSAFLQHEFSHNSVPNGHYPSSHTLGGGETNLAYSTADPPTISNCSCNLPHSGGYCSSLQGILPHRDAEIGTKMCRNQERHLSPILGTDPAVSKHRDVNRNACPYNLAHPFYQQQEGETSAFHIPCLESDIDEAGKRKQTAKMKRPWHFLAEDLDLSTSATMTEANSNPDCSKRRDKAEKEEEGERGSHQFDIASSSSAFSRCSEERKPNSTSLTTQRTRFSDTIPGGDCKICLQPDPSALMSGNDYSEMGNGDFLTLKLTTSPSYHSDKRCNSQSERTHGLFLGNSTGSPKQPHLSSLCPSEQVERSYTTLSISVQQCQQVNINPYGLRDINLDLSVKDEPLELRSANEEAQEAKQEEYIDLELRL